MRHLQMRAVQGCQCTVRAMQAGVPPAVIMPIMGQLVAGCLPVDNHQNPIVGEPTTNNCMPDVDGGEWKVETAFGLFVNDAARIYQGIRTGQRCPAWRSDRIETEVNGEVVEGEISQWGWFRLGIASDALGPIQRRPLLGLSGNQAGPAFVSDRPLSVILVLLSYATIGYASKGCRYL